MRFLVSLLILLAAYGASGATFQSVGTTNDLVLLPAPSLSVSSNFVVSSTADSTTLEAWQWQTGDSHSPDGITYLASVFQPTAGNFVKMSFGGGGGFINPTDGFEPYRIDSTHFGDSAWFHISTNRLGFNGTNTFLFYRPDGAFPNLSILAIGNGTLTNIAANQSAIVAIGEQAIGQAEFAGGSVAVGWNAGAFAVTNWINSTAVGYGAGEVESIASSFFGNSAGPSSATVVIESTFLGMSSGAATGVAGAVMPGSTNTTVGFQASYPGGGGSITAVGAHSGEYVQGNLGVMDRSWNTYLGTYAGWSPTTNTIITNAVAIGFNASLTNSGEIVLGNASNTTLYTATSLANGGQSNRWIFKGVTIGATTNVTVNVNGKDYSFVAF